MKLIDPEKGDGTLVQHLTPDTHSVLIVFWHGVGDVVMFLPLLEELRMLFPVTGFRVGICAGLDEEEIIPDAVLLQGNWREECANWGYDLVFLCHFPIENAEDTQNTKADICRTRELGLAGEPPHATHLPIVPRPLVAVHFQMTSVPWVANADEDVARLIWDDIIRAGYQPIETHFEHAFHNPVNARYPFVDNHMRGNTARLRNLISIIGACDYFVGVVSGNFHLAMSILGPDRVMLLEKDLRASHFTRDKIATANLKDYRGEVLQWLTKNTAI